MNHLTQKEKILSTGLSGRLRRWIKDEHAVGLAVHDGWMSASHFAERKGRPVLNALAVQAYDPSISDRDLARQIRSFWKKHKLPTRTVCSSLYTHSLIVRAFSYPNVAAHELPRVLALEAEAALQLPQEKIAKSWHINTKTFNTNELSGVLVAAPRNIVRTHINLLKSAGLLPVNVEIDCSAVINLYAFLSERGDESPVCMVNLTSNMAGIVPFAGHAATPRIVYSSSKNGWEDNLDYLIENIESALLYYQLKTQGGPAGKLLLTGRPLPDEAMRRFTEAMSVPVNRWSPVSDGNLPLPPHLEKELSAGKIPEANLATSLGLGLRCPKREL